MILTEELLLKWDACEEGIDFCQRNKLFGFDLDRIDEIRGDYNNFATWLKNRYNNIILDDNGNIIKSIYSLGFYVTYEYNSNGNIIKQQDSNGVWSEWEYNSNGNVIKQQDSYGDWSKWEYDSNNNLLKEEHENGKRIVYEYDNKNNLIKLKRFDETWISYEYDSHSNKIYFCWNENVTPKTSYTEFYPNGQLKQFDDLYIPLILV